MNNIFISLILLFSATFVFAENKVDDGAKYFVNVSSATGLSDISVQNGVWADINHDGYPDLIVSGNDNGLKMRVLLNTEKDGKRIFTDFTEESGLNKDPDNPDIERNASFVIAGDVNNDGYIDLFSAMYCEFDKPKTDKEGNILKNENGEVIYEKQDNGLRSQIYLNDGKGHFKTPENRTEFIPETTSSAAYLDYNKDGILDLFIGNWYKEYGISLISYVSHLYQGNGDGTFTDVTEEAMLLTEPTEGEPDSSRPVYGVTHCDWNNDGYDDILVSVYGRQANRLWKNNGDGTFSDIGEETHFNGDDITHGEYPQLVKRTAEKKFRSHGNTFSAACGDYNNDGNLDVFLGEITHGWAGDSSDKSNLLENQGAKKGYIFKRSEVLNRPHPENNWNQGDMRVTWADFDNDGALELLLSSGDYPDGQYLRLYKPSAAEKFVDITDKAGFNWESSAGISVADFDNDGLLDIMAGKSWMRMPNERKEGRVPAPALFINQIKNNNNWISLTIVGNTTTAVTAAGTRVRLTAGKTTQIRYPETSHGHSGLADEQRLHFGLGKNATADIAIDWNSGTKTYSNIPANSFIRITENSDKVEISKKPFSLNAKKETVKSEAKKDENKATGKK